MIMSMPGFDYYDSRKLEHSMHLNVRSVETRRLPCGIRIHIPTSTALGSFASTARLPVERKVLRPLDSFPKIELIRT
jgi:hypothetical protein